MGIFPDKDNIPQIMTAEVLSVVYDTADPDTLYGVRVRILDMNRHGIADNDSNIAVPINRNSVQLPNPGEMVLVMYAPDASTSGNVRSHRLYYFETLSVHGSIADNALPKASEITIAAPPSDYEETQAGNTNQAETSDEEGEAPTIKPLKANPGDTLITSRFGSSIRMSSGDVGGAASGAGPITIIKNSAAAGEQEDLNSDESSFVLSSGQKLTFTPGADSTKAAKMQGLSYTSEGFGGGPQALLTSGRIVFNSTQKEIIGFAKSGVSFSSGTVITLDAGSTVTVEAPTIQLGTNAEESLILGNSWAGWMKDLIDTIGSITIITPAGVSSPIKFHPLWLKVIFLKLQIEPFLLSKVSYTKLGLNPKKFLQSIFSSLIDEGLAQLGEHFELVGEIIETYNYIQKAAVAGQELAPLVSEKNANGDVVNHTKTALFDARTMATGATGINLESSAIKESAESNNTVLLNTGLTEEDKEAIDKVKSQESPEDVEPLPGIPDLIIEGAINLGESGIFDPGALEGSG